jgi:hypothetical protein
MRVKASQAGVWALAAALIAVVIVAQLWVASENARDREATHGRSAQEAMEDPAAPDAAKSASEEASARAARAAVTGERAASGPSLEVLDSRRSPLGQIAVRFLWDEDRLRHVQATTTDAEGRARLDWPSIRAPLVQAEIAPSDAPPFATLWDPTIDAQVMVPPSLIVRGVVLDFDTGRGVDGAQVSWQLDEPLLAALPVERVTVDGDGQFRLSVPALHPLRIDVVAPDHEPASLSLATLASQSDADRLPLTVHMPSWQHFGGFRFRATDENDSEIRQGLLLSSSLFGAREARIEPDPERGGVIAYAWGANLPLVWTESLGPSILRPGTVVLGPRRTLTVDVKESEGRELSGALTMKVWMEVTTAPDTVPVTAVFESWPVAMRDFPVTLPVVHGLTRGDISVEGPDVAPGSLKIEAADWPADARTLQRTMVLKRVRMLTLLVHDRDGHPIPQAAVRAEYPSYSSSMQPSWQVVDGAGRAMLPASEDRPLREVWVRARGFLPVVIELPSDATGPASVTLARAGLVRGRVVDQVGQPVAGASIQYDITEWPGGDSRYPETAEVDGQPCQSDYGYEFPVTGATTDLDGSFVLDDLLPGMTVRLSLDAPNHMLLQQPIVSVGGSDVELRVRTMAPILFRFRSLPAGGFTEGEIVCERISEGESEAFPDTMRVIRFPTKGLTQDLSDMMPAGRYRIDWTLDSTRGVAPVVDIGNGLTVVEIW